MNIFTDVPVTGRPPLTSFWQDVRVCVYYVTPPPPHTHTHTHTHTWIYCRWLRDILISLSPMLCILWTIILLDRWMNESINGWMDGWMNDWMDGWMDWLIIGWIGYARLHSGMDGRKCFFNVPLNTFYLRLFGVGYIVNDHLARMETRCRHYMGYSFSISNKELFICTIPQTGFCFTSRGALAGTRNNSMGPS